VSSVGHYIRQIPRLLPVSGSIILNSGEKNFRSHMEDVVLEVEEGKSEVDSDDQNGLID